MNTSVIKSNQLLYNIALSFLPGIGDVLAKNLLSYCGSAEKIFSTKKEKLIKIPGIGLKAALAIVEFKDWNQVEKEILFIEKNNIDAIFYTDEAYPKKLKNCVDSPLLLYKKGKADLNTEKIIGIVGTRNSTNYGKEVCEKIIEDMTAYNPTIVSGLAYGVDIVAHKAALKNGLSTIGVLAHGLDTLYPFAHNKVAASMLDRGALLSDFPSNTKLNKVNFPKRNRIVAGMVDAIVVIESGAKGGAMITAEIANSYNRDVFAVPGAVNAPFSTGCNHLIKTNKAALVQSAEDIAYILGWENKVNRPKKQKELLLELNDNEKAILDILQQKDFVHIDEIATLSNLSISNVSSVLLTLEFMGAVQSLPGKRYKLA